MWTKFSAAVLLGLPLSVGLIGLLALLMPGPDQQLTLPWLLMTFPLWVAVMALAFLFRNGKRSWLVLGSLTILCFVSIALFKSMSSIS